MARPAGVTRRAVVGLAVLALAAAGCAGIPASGRVHLGRAVVGVAGLDDSDIRVLPPAPTDGESPTDIVHGFLVASRNAEDDHSIARLYLTPAASRGWQSEGRVTVYDERDVGIDLAQHTPTRTEVTVTTARIGEVGPDGGYSPQASTLTLRFHLVKVAKQWRITDPPAGVLLSTLDLARSFRAADVYYLDPSQQVLVPDRVFLQVPRLGLATGLVRALLDGPTKWLAPAVRSAVPSGTTLIGNVPVNDGVADVDLSRDVLRASPSARAALSAQIVWTLRQLSEISAVRVLADGTPLTVPGAGDRQPRDSWAQFSPDGAGSVGELFYVDGKVLRTSDGAVVNGPLGQGELSLRHPAISSDSSRVAALVGPVGRTTLYVGPVDGRPVARLSAVAMTPPCFDRNDTVWTVVTRPSGAQQVVAVSNGTARVVPMSGIAPEPVQQLRLSRDGTRVAVVVGPVGAGKLLVGRVTTSRDGVALSGFREVLTSYDAVSAVAWADADHLVALARPGGAPVSTHRVPVRVDVDGYSSVALARLDSAPDSIAAAPERPVVVSAGGQVWTSVLGVWRVLGRGSDPVYPD
jgi:hypothetical protein